jgi:CDP-diacylglycerol---glycerol-3-phosphate 3-phosphatidyltransferase
VKTGGRSTAILMGITYLRMILVPVVMALILIGDDTRGAFVVAAVLFATAAGTDFVDGFLARRWDVSTTLGSFLDTTADKLLVSGALIALVGVGRASPWAATIIVGRELLILGLRGFVAADGTVMSPSIWGKLKASVQFVAITLAIVRTSEELGPLFLDEYVMIVAVAITVMSAVEYLTRFHASLTRDSR